MLINNNRVKKFRKNSWASFKTILATIIYKENVSVVTEGLQKILEKPLNRPKNMQ